MFRFNEILKKQTFFLNFTKKTFTGKTETGWKFTTPILKMKSVKPIPPPGNEITKMLPSKSKKLKFRLDTRLFL